MIFLIFFHDDIFIVEKKKISLDVMHRISTWNRSTNFEGEGFLDYRASSHVASRIRAKEIRGKDRLDLDLPPRGREVN